MTTTLSQRIDCLSQLGTWISDQLNKQDRQSRHKTLLAETMADAWDANPWFTPEETQRALNYWAKQLTSKNLKEWMSHYPEISAPRTPSEVLIIQAGNIPLVGFHDLISVFLSGHQALIKASSRDTILMKAMVAQMLTIHPPAENLLRWYNPSNHSPKALIATGSDQSARMFRSQYRHLPTIIRHNRSSVALLMGHESDHEIQALCGDILDYYGLGCRNVSQLAYLSESCLSRLVHALQNTKSPEIPDVYRSNLTYQRARMHMNNTPFIDAGTVLLSENPSLHPPIGVLHTLKVDSAKQYLNDLRQYDQQIQCVVGHESIQGMIPYGSTQQPALWDYADGVDTIDFLIHLNTEA